MDVGVSGIMKRLTWLRFLGLGRSDIDGDRNLDFGVESSSLGSVDDGATSADSSSPAELKVKG